MRQLPPEITWIYLDGPPCKIQPNHAPPRPIRVLMKTTLASTLFRIEESRNVHTPPLQLLVIGIKVAQTELCSKKLPSLRSRGFADSVQLLEQTVRRMTRNGKFERVRRKFLSTSAREKGKGKGKGKRRKGR